MSKRLSRRAAVGFMALGVVLTSLGIAASQMNDEGYVGPCKTDRSELRRTVVTGSTHKELSDAALAGIHWLDSYGELDAAEIGKVVAASQSADSETLASGEVVYTVDPDFEDTDEIVDFRMMVLQNGAGEYEPVEGRYCARIVTGKLPEVAP